jgi:tetratricopeptide (TPR) repeat protein
MKCASKLTRTSLSLVRHTLLALALGLICSCGGGATQAKSPDDPALDDDTAEGGGAVEASSPKVREGMDALQQGDFATAEGILAEARAEDPDDPQAAFYLGVAYEGLEDMTSARKNYREALELDPELTEASVNLSGILLDVDQNPGAALKVTSVGLKSSPKHPGLLLNHALGLEATGDWEGAAKTYAALVKVAPNKPNIRLSYAIALHKCNQKDAALEQLARAAKAKDLKVLAPTARLYGVLGAYNACSKTFDRVIKLQKLPEFLVRRALCKKAAGKLDAAVADLQEALNMDDKYAPAHLHIGLVFKEQDRKEEARHALKKAVETGEGTKIAEEAKQALSGL